MRVLYIHAGDYKAGSSSLQRFCSAQRKELLKRGIDYTPVGRGTRVAHEPLLRELWTESGAQNGFPLWSELLANILRGGERTIYFVSSEAFQDVRPSRWRWIADTFQENGIKVRMIFWIRPHIDASLARASQRAKLGIPIGSLDDYLTSRAFSRHFLYEPKIEGWRNVFGEDNVIARAFSKDNLVGADIVMDYLSLWRLSSEEEFRDLESYSVNQAVPIKVCALMQRVWEIHGIDVTAIEHDDRKHLNRVFLVPLIERLADLHKGAPTKFSISKAVHQRLVDIYYNDACYLDRIIPTANGLFTKCLVEHPIAAKTSSLQAKDYFSDQELTAHDLYMRLFWTCYREQHRLI